MWETEIVRKCLTPQILILLPSHLLIFYRVAFSYQLISIKPELRFQWHRLM